MIRFRCLGIPVVVQPFFWITLALIGGALSAKSPEDFLRLGLFLIAGFISILVHEMGHALIARRYGAWSEITLEAFGGFATYSGARPGRWQSMAISAAGPVFQILLGLAVWSMIPFTASLSPNAKYFLSTLVLISLFWAILNLLPVLPLDGGRILEALLGPQRIRITLWVSIVIAVVSGLWMYSTYGSILFAVFMGFFAWRAYQALASLPGR
jgi:Zn-dependent protease